MSTVIKVENLGKKYMLRHQSAQQPYVALRDVLTDGVRNACRRLTSLFSRSPIPSPQSQTSEEFWALKDVSFEVKQGDRIGIIGRNGAGKSTLLKILSRITEPTTGSVRIRGRVASLLEVGTGFHPELTGRENIFLNGAILGMSRAEIKRKFDEIVAFAETERFLDTPVKRYSSGMYVRLAFAVAAHLEPEILVVDEVLAVGDAQFQKKCLGKMEEAGKEGRTLFFVSHNMAAVNRLCSCVLWVQEGRTRALGETGRITAEYLTDGAEGGAQLLFDRHPGCTMQYLSVCVTDSEGNSSRYLADDREFAVELEVAATEPTAEVYFGLILQNSEGVNVLFADSRDEEGSVPSRFHPGSYRLRLRIPPILAPGRYQVTSLGIATTNPLVVLDYVESACFFEVVNNSNVQRSAARPGIINLHLLWEMKG